MKSLLFKRRVRDGQYFADHMFTAPEGTEEILPFDQEGTSQEISSDWAAHYAQQTSVLNVHSSMAFSLEEFPVERINSKYYIGDSVTEGLYYDEISEPSHLSNCVHGSEEEGFDFIEVVDATLPAYFYMEKEQKAVEYVPFMGWFTTFGRNRNRKPAVVNDTEKRFPAAFTAYRNRNSELQISAVYYAEKQNGYENAFEAFTENYYENNAQGILYIAESQEELTKLMSNFPQEVANLIKVEKCNPRSCVGNYPGYVRCVDAVHKNPEGEASIPYRWEVPEDMIINPEDVLVVESHIGASRVVVYAITEDYGIRKDEEIHPYCAVVHNCGKL